MIRNKSWKKYEFNLIWVGVNDYIFFFPPMGDKKQVPHAHVFDPTQKKPKGVGILNRGLKKKYTRQGNWTVD